MLNILLNVLGIVGIIASIVIYFIVVYNWQEDKPPSKFPMLIGILISSLTVVFGNSFSIIPTGYTGVKTTFGQISQESLQSGFNFKIPFVQSIEKVNNKQQDISFTEQIWSETAARTAIYYEGVTVTYQISSDKSAWIYANVSNYEESLVSHPLVASSIKSVSKNYTDTDATNRSKVEPASLEALQNSLNEKYGENTVVVIKVTINNIDFDDSYNQAIANKQKAQLEYEQQAILNQQSIEKAEAEKQVAITNAEAEAEAIRIKAQAEADSNEIIAASISEEIVEYKLAEARNKFGWITVSGSTSTIIDLPQETNTPTSEETQE